MEFVATSSVGHVERALQVKTDTFRKVGAVVHAKWILLYERIRGKEWADLLHKSAAPNKIARTSGK